MSASWALELKQYIIILRALSRPSALRDAVYTRPHKDQLRSAAAELGCMGKELHGHFAQLWPLLYIHIQLFPLFWRHRQGTSANLACK